MVDEARTEVCAPKLGGGKYSLVRGQQEAAEDNQLEVPTPAHRIRAILRRPILGAWVTDHREVERAPVLSLS